MALYGGWNEEEIRRGIPTHDIERTYDNPGHAMASFTPVNPSRAPVEFISPLKTLYAKPDGEDLYDLQPESDSTAAVASGKKRGAAAASKGQTVSLGVVWEYSNGDGENDTHPKRQKTAPAKRSKPAKKSSENVPAFQDLGLLDLEAGDVGSNVNFEALQLTTPPDSRKKAKKGMLANAQKKKGPFANTIVTKALPRGRDETFQTTSTISHLGWTTTEEMVKANSSLIAKTTLDKLAAFRYKSSTESQLNNIPPNPLETEEGTKKTTDRLQQENSQDDGFTQSKPLDDDEMLDDYQPSHRLPSYFSGDGVHNQGPDNPPYSSHIQGQLAEDNRFFSDAICITKDLSGAMVRELPHESSSTSLIPPFSGSTPQQLAREASEYRAISESKGPILDEAERRNSQVNSLDILLEVDYFDHKPAENNTCEVEMQVNSTSLNIAQSQLSQADSQEVTLEESCECEISAELPEQELLPPRLGWQINPIEVKRSDMDDFEVVPRNIVNGYDLDEFDEGLDDSDFLGMAPNVVIPATHNHLSQRIDPSPSVNQKELSIQKGFVIRTNLPTSLAIAIASDKPRSVGHAVNLDSSPRPVIDIESDDDFPMDEADEEEMQKLLEAPRAVTESFQAPASLQYPFDDDAASGGVFDSSLQFSPVRPQSSHLSPRKVGDATNKNSSHEPITHQNAFDSVVPEEEADWTFLHSRKITTSQGNEGQMKPPTRPRAVQGSATSVLKSRARGPEPPHPKRLYSQSPDTMDLAWSIIDDSHEYEPLKPFARPDFPELVRDRCPIVGVTTQNFLRVCFRIGEMLKEGSRCEALKKNATVELFARVTFSSREPGTTKQHFQFADLWHDRPPFPNGLLTNYKSSELANRESKIFLTASEGMMARCLGKLKWDSKSTAMMLHIINIRETDWEEIRWTKRIVSADQVKSEKA